VLRDREIIADIDPDEITIETLLTIVAKAEDDA
jgi:hypothetical protein